MAERGPRHREIHVSPGVVQPVQVFDGERVKHRQGPRSGRDHVRASGTEEIGTEGRPGFKELFTVDHPLIGRHRLPPLSADGIDIDRLREDAVRNVRDLHENGMHAVIIGSGDNLEPGSRMPDTSTGLYTEVMQAVVEEAGKHGMRVGVQVDDDPETAIEIAHAVRADFVRIDVVPDPTFTVKDFTGKTPAIKEQGIKLVNKNHELDEDTGRPVYLLIDVHTGDNSLNLIESVVALARAGADAILVTRTQQDTELTLDEVIDVIQTTRIVAMQDHQSEDKALPIILEGENIYRDGPYGDESINEIVYGTLL